MRAALEALKLHDAELLRQLEEHPPQQAGGDSALTHQRPAAQQCERLQQELMQERLQHEQVGFHLHASLSGL